MHVCSLKKMSKGCDLVSPSKNGMKKLIYCIKFICVISILGFFLALLYSIYAWDVIRENVVGYIVMPVATFLILWGILSLQLKLGFIKPCPMLLIALAFLLFGVIIMLRLLAEQAFIPLPFGNGIVLGASAFIWQNQSQFLFYP